MTLNDPFKSPNLRFRNWACKFGGAHWTFQVWNGWHEWKPCPSNVENSYTWIQLVGIRIYSQLLPVWRSRAARLGCNCNHAWLLLCRHGFHVSKTNRNNHPPMDHDPCMMHGACACTETGRREGIVEQRGAKSIWVHGRDHTFQGSSRGISRREIKAVFSLGEV